MVTKDMEFYEEKSWRKYDIALFFASLEANIPDVPYKNFFEKGKKEKMEWLSKDLVVDRREGWK